MEDSFWSPLHLSDNEIMQRQVDRCSIWLKKHDDEIWFTHQYSEEEGHKFMPDDPPPDADWSRWVLRKPADHLLFEPVMPDRPLVIMPEFPMHISKDAQLQVFTRIPLWVRVQTDDPNPEVILELPIVPVSKTWFGTMVDGELCYYSTTKARRTLNKDVARPWLVNCPIIIENESESSLDFQRFCYRVEHLTIYETNAEFWADETKISYQGEDQVSNISMRGKVHANLNQPKLRTRPRESLSGNLAKRTFRRIIKDFPFIR